MRKAINLLVGLGALFGSIAALFIYTPWQLALLMTLQVLIVWSALGETLTRTERLKAQVEALEGAPKLVVTKTRRDDEPLH